MRKAFPLALIRQMNLIQFEGCEAESEDKNCVSQLFLPTCCSKFPTKTAYTRLILRVKTTMKYVLIFFPKRHFSLISTARAEEIAS